MVKIHLRLALALVLLASPAFGVPFLGSCAEWLSSATRPVRRLLWGPAPALSPADLATLRAWAARFRGPAGFRCAHFPALERWRMLSLLPRELRATLFSPPEGARASGAHDWLSARLQALGFPPWEYAPLDAALLVYWDSHWTAARASALYEELEARIAEAEALDGARRAALDASTALRFRVLAAQERLARRMTPEYRIRFDGGSLVVPDGMRYAYRRAWGGVRIEVRYGDLLRTQFFESPSVVRAYLAAPFLGWGGFVGDLGPDGRFHIYDQHHRTRAYALRHARPGQPLEDVLIPVLVERASDGHYYTATHWTVLSSGNFIAVPTHERRWYADRLWSFLDGEERERIIEGSKESPLRAIRDVYYRETGLPRLH